MRNYGSESKIEQRSLNGLMVGWAQRERERKDREFTYFVVGGWVEIVQVEIMS